MNKKKTVLSDYFYDWMETYKKPLVSQATYVKYKNTHAQIIKYFGDVSIGELTASIYQRTINNYSQTHAKLTVSCFHKQIHACILDAVDESLIVIDPTRKAIITGRKKESNKSRYLNYTEWKLLVNKTYNSENIMDQIIYLAAVTGMRYAEVLGLTWDNIDFVNRKIEVTKTWDYKYHKGFIDTKNKSSRRKIDVDSHTLDMLKTIKAISQIDSPYNLVFYYTQGKELYSANINKHLSALCTSLKLKEISFHSLRHTQASILLYLGLSILTVSKRLGHSNVTTTQEVYIHIIKEMQEKESESIVHAIDSAFL